MSGSERVVFVTARFTLKFKTLVDSSLTYLFFPGIDVLSSSLLMRF